MGEEIVAVCDQCKTKQSFSCYQTATAFLRRHRRCNFSGCRVVLADNPCPNRVKAFNYKTEGEDVVRPGFYAEITRD